MRSITAKVNAAVAFIPLAIGNANRDRYSYACHAHLFRLRQSEKVRFTQIRALRQSEAVVLGLREPGGEVTS